MDNKYDSLVMDKHISKSKISGDPLVCSISYIRITRVAYLPRACILAYLPRACILTAIDPELVLWWLILFVVHGKVRTPNTRSDHYEPRAVRIDNNQIFFLTTFPRNYLPAVPKLSEWTRAKIWVQRVFPYFYRWF